MSDADSVKDAQFVKDLIDAPSVDEAAKVLSGAESVKDLIDAPSVKDLCDVAFVEDVSGAESV